MNRKKRLLLVLGVLVCLAGLYAAARWQSPSPRRPPDLYPGDIPRAVSREDRDGDGIDDQTDILEGALAYVETRPRYKSRYYGGGYPDDGFGVCTDVVAMALQNAGYDLMALVAADKGAHPEAYPPDVADERIDFRRVKNLDVYFSRTARVLTTDPGEIEEWQGGDIVVFPHHIGVVSDRRDRDGVPYVIHHKGPWQRAYEEDVLNGRGDILGHYRVESPEADGGAAVPRGL